MKHILETVQQSHQLLEFIWHSVASHLNSTLCSDDMSLVDTFGNFCNTFHY
jgi:hypothetical protein